MELLFFLVPTFLHGLLTGKISFTKTDEDFAVENFKIGVELFKKGKIVESFRYLESKLYLYPKNAYLHYYIGKCHYHYENYEAALKSFDISLRFETTILDVYYFKAHCHYFLEDWENAHFQALKALRFYGNKNEALKIIIQETEII